MNRRTVWLVRVFVMLMIGVDIVLAFAWYLKLTPLVFAIPLLALGPRPPCSMLQTERALYNEYLQTSRTGKIDRGSVIVERAGNLLHYRTPAGMFWIPDGMNLASLQAEIDVKYRHVGGLQVRPGDIVLDCGANVGVFTRAALQAGARTVVAIEPSPRNIECLRRTFSTGIASGRVLLYPKGVWDRDDVLSLNESSTSAEDSFVIHRKEYQGSIQVPLTTIDKLSAELRLPRVDFIKMDIEGAERRALAGARQVITRFRPKLEISLNHLPDDPVVLPQIIRQFAADYREQCLMCTLKSSPRRVEADIAYFQY